MIRIFKHDYPLKNIFLMISEGVSIWVSIYISSSLIFNLHPERSENLFFKIILITSVCQVCLYYNELYNMQIGLKFKELGIRILQSLGVSSILLGILYVLLPGLMLETKVFALSVLFAVVFIISWRLVYAVISNLRIFKKNIILLGSSPLAEQILDLIYSKSDYGYAVPLYIPEDRSDTRAIHEKYPDIQIAQGLKTLMDIIRKEKIKKIVVSLKEKRKNFPLRELLDCRVKGIEIVDGNSFYETLSGKISVENINPGWLIFSEGFQKSFIKSKLKRLSDIVISTAMIVLLSPVIGILALAIKLESGGPIFFTQDRVGERKKNFKIIKFRSMVDNAEKISGPVWADENDPRVTRIGRYLRKFRLDEIPQLWNVCKGEMSFVGPRPERECFVGELERIIPYYSERFSVKPGLTGWAQVKYGYGANIEDAIEKLNYDLFYIKNMTLFMDLMIIIRTVRIVLFGKGGR